MRKRISIILLAIMMVISTMPVSVLAESVNGESQNTVATAQQQSSLTNTSLNGFDWKKYSEATVFGSIQLIPDYGCGIGTAVTPFLQDFLGIGGGMSTEELWEKISEEFAELKQMLAELSVQLDASTQEILVNQYGFAQFQSNFQEPLNNLKAATANVYSEINRVMGDPNTSGEYKTLFVAELLSTTDSSTDSFINQLDALMGYLNGTNAVYDGEKSVLKVLYNLGCYKSKLGGEAALEVSPYLNQVIDVMRQSYSACLIVLQAKQYVKTNWAAIVAKGETLKAEGDSSLYDLVQLASGKYGSTFVPTIIEKDKRFASFFLTEEECAERDRLREEAYKDEIQKLLSDKEITLSDKDRAILEGCLNHGQSTLCEESDTYSLEKHNNYIGEHWFDFIREARIESSHMIVDVVLLDRALGVMKASDGSLVKDANKVNRKLHSALEVIETPTGKVNEVTMLTDHIRENRNNVFLPEQAETGQYVKYTLRELLEDYGFIIPECSEKFYIGSNADGQNITGLPDPDTDAEKYKYNDAGTVDPGSMKNWESVGALGDGSDNSNAFYYFCGGKQEINSTDAFVRMIESVAKGNAYYGKSFVLTADIDLSEYDYSSRVWPKEDFEKQFCGTFDGKDPKTGVIHKISNLKDDTGDKLDFRGGLFRTLGDGADIKNLIIENPNVKGANFGYGALAGMSIGNVSISNVRVEGGSVKCSGQVGGLIGLTDKNGGLVITDCYNSAEVYGPRGPGGGIVGSLENDDYCYTVTNCQNDGRVHDGTANGGIIGAVNSDAQNHNFSGCTNTGYITSYRNCGGIIGHSYGGCNLTKCSNTGKIEATSSASNAGGIIGYSTNYHCDFSGSVNGAIIDDQGNIIPVPNPGEIVSLKERAGGIAGFVGYEEIGRDWDEYIQYTAKNCKNYGKVTGYWDSGGIIGFLKTNNAQNDFSGCTNEGNVSVEGNGYCAGGIIGASRGGGNLTGCKNTGHIKATAGNNSNAGGIIGWNQDDHFDFSGSVNGVVGQASDEEIGRVEAGKHAGGIAGEIGDKDVNDVQYTGKNCKNYGKITGVYNVGGIVGNLFTDNNAHEFSGCRNEGYIESTNTDGYGAGGIVGANYGGGNFTSCTNIGHIKALKGNAAGIIAYVQDDPTDFSGSVNGEDGKENDKEIGRIEGGHASGGIAGYLGDNYYTQYIGKGCKNYGEISTPWDAGGIVGGIDGKSWEHQFTGCINKGNITCTSNDCSAGGIIAAACGGGHIDNSENWGTISAATSKSQTIAWKQFPESWTTTGFVYKGLVTFNVSLEKDNLKDVVNKKGDNAIEHKMELLNAYENLTEEDRQKMSSDRDSMQLISALIKQVKDQNHQFKLNDHSVLLLGTGENGTDNPNWRLILTANKLETIPEAINAKIAKGWKVLAADNIAVTRYGGGDIEGEFTIGFSGNEIERYKNAQAMVYHLLADGTVEELKATWNEEQKCFTVVTDSFSPFVLAVKADSGVSTGDDSNIFLYGLATILALLGAGFVYGLRRKEEK